MNKYLRILRRSVRELMMLPISPRSLVAIVWILRSVHVIREPRISQKADIDRILISHPYSSLGDMVLLLPLIERVKTEWPHAEIDIVVGRDATELLDEAGGLHTIFVCESHRSHMGILGEYLRFFRHLLLYRRNMMSRNYDLAIAPRWGSILQAEAVFLVYLTGATRRIGYSGSVDGGSRAVDIFLTKAATGGVHEHETVRNLKLLDRAGLTRAPALTYTCVDHPIEALIRLAAQNNPRTWLAIKTDSDMSNRKYAVVSPGATAPFRIWPIESLACAMRAIHKECGLIFYVVGGPSDNLLCRALAEQNPEFAYSLAGKTNLRQLAGLLASADLFLGMDSGAAHIAGGLGIPTVVISPFPRDCGDEHPNSPIRFRPCGPKVQVLQPRSAIPPCKPTCSFSESHCIRQVCKEEVVQAVLRLISSLKTYTSPGVPPAGE